MAQSDQIVQDATFPTVRADINDNLAALFSQSSGPSAPATTVAFQPWVDTSSTPPVWKVRNASNNGWITVGVLDPAGFKTGGVTPIVNGGTGATTAAAALAALLPSQTGQAGKGLTTDGTVASWGTIAAGASIQIFTGSGTYTPTAGKTTFLVFATGGGGGGGGGSSSGTTYTSGGGGGGGGTGIQLFTSLSLGASATITIGNGGAGGTTAFSTSSTAGSNGGSSSVTPANGSTPILTGQGGAGGGRGVASSTPPVNGSGGNGGGTINSILNITGSAGNDRLAGVSFWGSTIAGGGTGGIGPGINGTAGQPGVVLILEW
jgi:hypothetical protein